MVKLRKYFANLGLVVLLLSLIAFPILDSRLFTIKGWHFETLNESKQQAHRTFQDYSKGKDTIQSPNVSFWVQKLHSWSVANVLDHSSGLLVFTGLGYQNGDPHVWIAQIDEQGTLIREHNHSVFQNGAINDVIEYSDGTLVVVGTKRTHDPDKIMIFLMRVSCNGTRHWYRAYDYGEDLRGWSVVECADGGFVVGTRTIEKTWLLRFDENGTLLWNKTFDTGSYFGGVTVVRCRDGGYALLTLGFFSWLNESFVLLRTDVNGTLLWWQNFYVQSPYHLDMAYRTKFPFVECEDGGFAIAATSNFYKYGLPGRPNAFLIRTDYQGNPLWNLTYGGAHWDEFKGIIQCQSGGFVMIGDTTSSGNSDRNLWLVRVDDEGNLEYSYTFDYFFGPPYTEYKGIAITEHHNGRFVIAARGSGYLTTGYWGISIPDDSEFIANLQQIPGLLYQQAVVLLAGTCIILILFVILGCLIVRRHKQAQRVAK